jgi:hypothetical protein
MTWRDMQRRVRGVMGLVKCEVVGFCLQSGHCRKTVRPKSEYFSISSVSSDSTDHRFNFSLGKSRESQDTLVGCCTLATALIQHVVA